MRFIKIGNRNLKTALSVLICVASDAFLQWLLKVLPEGESLFYKILGIYISRNMLVYACIAAVIVMCSSFSLSVKSGRDRTAGTILGGAAGILFLFLKQKYLHYDVIVFPLGVVVLIAFLTLIEKGEIVVITLTVFFITMINSEEQAHIYVMAKVLATVLGTLISLMVNRFIKPEVKKYEKEN